MKSKKYQKEAEALLKSYLHILESRPLTDEEHIKMEDAIVKMVGSALWEKKDDRSK